MFYYTAGTYLSLEVNVSENYSEADLERILLFVDALVDSPKMVVTFNVNTHFKEHLQDIIEHQNYHRLYTYTILERTTK